jgi:hypothetical protein
MIGAGVKRLQRRVFEKVGSPFASLRCQAARIGITALALGLGARAAFAQVSPAAGVQRVAPNGPGRNGELIRELEEHMRKEDHLGGRILVKRIAARGFDAREWTVVRGLLFRYPRVGHDVVLAWDKRRPRVGDVAEVSAVDKLLQQADGQLLDNKAREAAAIYLKVAGAMRKRVKALEQLKPEARPDTYQNIRYLYPYVLHHLARALYTMGRYNEAFEIYTWFDPTYAQYRQTLFERMWAAFMSGRVDHALGAIAAQRSDYFSRFLEPETYIIQIYLYKKLCRADDLRQVLGEVKDFKERLQNGKYGVKDWANNDVETHDLEKLAEDTVREGDPLVPVLARKHEQELIRARLARAFETERKRFQETIELTLAYAQLATSGDTDARLKPVEKLPDRGDLFRQNLEIWPADRAEDWIDEVGNQRFLGESLCGQPPKDAATPATTTPQSSWSSGASK